MGVKITDVRFNNEFRPAQNLKYLLSCIGEKISVEIDVEFSDIVYATPDNFLKLEPLNSELDIADNIGVVYCEDGISFSDFAVGDTIGINNTISTTDYTITEIIDGGTVRVSIPLGGPTTLPAESYVFNKTPFKGFRYAYNMVEGGASYDSLVDAEYQQGEIGTADATNLSLQPMTFTGIKSYQIGSLQIKGRGTEGLNQTVGDVKQLFTIVHSTYVTPFFLAEEYNDLILGIKPDYFTSNDCLNYIAKFEFGKVLTNPNGLQTLNVPTNASNTGWYNERFNGGVNYYVVSSLILKKGVDVVSALQFSTDITVEIIVDNTQDSPFSDTNTQYTFGFNYLPESQTLYQNNGYNQARNFLIDSKTNTLGNGSVNGDSFGTPLQVIKSVTSTYISATQMKITATINTGADANAILQQGDFDRYKFWVITENHALNPEDSDKVALLSNGFVNEFYVQQNATDVIKTDGSTFIQHPYDDKVDASTGADAKLFPADDVVANTDFYIDFNNAPTEGGVLASTSGLNYSPVQGVPATLMIYDVTNNKIVAVADWQGSKTATQVKLRDSINDNVSYGTVFGGYPAYVDNGGYQNASVFTFGPNILVKFEAPDVGVAYNGIQFELISNYLGGVIVLTSDTMINGVDGTPVFPSSTAKILAVRSRLVLKDLDMTEADIILEDYNIDTSAVPIVGGEAQNIDFTADLGYKIPDEIRRNVKLNRDFSSDVDDKKYFNHQYGWMHRWEYWVRVLLSTVPADLFDNSLPNDGINHFWHRYTTIAYWALHYDIIFTIEQNGQIFEQSFSEQLADSFNFKGNVDWDECTTKTYDINAPFSELVNGGVPMIRQYEDVKLIASSKKIAGGIPNIANVGMALWIETYESGGNKDIRRISSFRVLSDNSWFKSIDGSGKALITKTVDVFTGECLIDHTKLPTNQAYTIYARLYEFINTAGYQFEDGNDYEFEDSIVYEFEAP